MRRSFFKRRKTDLKSSVPINKQNLQEKEEQILLEGQVVRQTKILQYHYRQIQTAVDVICSINQLIEPQELLVKVVELVKERFDLYFVGVFLIEGNRSGLIKFAELRAGSGDVGRQMLNDGFKLAVDDTSMTGSAILNRESRVAQDTGLDAVYFNNPYLPQTHSELALPLISGERVLGAMTLQSMHPGAFDDEYIKVLQGIADALTTALENARIYHETRRNMEEARVLNRQYLQQAWWQFAAYRGDLDYVYENGEENRQGETSQIKLPLSLHDQLIGEIIFEREIPDLSDEEKSFVEAVTNQAILALENARLLDATQRRAGTERLISDITRKARASNELEAILRITIQELGRAMHASEGVIRLERIDETGSSKVDPAMFETAGIRS